MRSAATSAAVVPFMWLTGSYACMHTQLYASWRVSGCPSPLPVPNARALRREELVNYIFGFSGNAAGTNPRNEVVNEGEKESGATTAKTQTTHSEAKKPKKAPASGLWLWRFIR